jgi:hypothetical protein
MGTMRGNPTPDERRHRLLHALLDGPAVHGGGPEWSGIAEVAAALSLFNAAVHATTYHLLLRRAQIGQIVPASVVDQFLDPWRLSYLDMAVYWAAIFVIVRHV